MEGTRVCEKSARVCEKSAKVCEKSTKVFESLRMRCTWIWTMCTSYPHLCIYAVQHSILVGGVNPPDVTMVGGVPLLKISQIGLTPPTVGGVPKPQRMLW